MFEVHTQGRDVFVRPMSDSWRTMKGSDGRDWVELDRDAANHLVNALRGVDRLTVTHDEEDG